MNYKNFIKAIAQKNDVTEKKARENLENIFSIIKDSLVEDPKEVSDENKKIIEECTGKNLENINEVRLHPLGKFVTYDIKEQKNRKIGNGWYDIPPKRILKFRPFKEAKRELGE